ncbi:zeta-crystallin [Rhizodiscina lignyota]|uniref:Zeta-crystallin n=1 Tax=Rhizodiscina lignyota TaxID=1504668 RepID=A0A9P4IJQ3_9PEZI|nr:zeta-crystallin [Rhizodiscina lignyota]
MALPDEIEAILIDNFVPKTSDLRVSSIPLPLPPEKRDTTLLIRTTHVSASHVDMLYFQGKHQNNRRHARPPFVLGTEFSGIIAYAPASSPFKPGDPVFGTARGAFADYVAVEAGTEGAVRRVPEAWGLRGAAAVGISGPVSYGALVYAGRMKKGETVLVLGAGGGLGVIAVQIAKQFGARVIAVVNTGAGSEGKVEMLKKLGADAVIGYQKEGWEEEVRKATPDGQGVHLVYDGVGAVLSSIKCCRFGGRVVIVGFAGRGGKMEDLKVNRVLLKQISLVGYRFGESSRQFPDHAKAVWDEFMQMVSEGKIKPVEYAESYNGLRDIPRALEDMHQRKVWGRAVVKISEEQGVEASRPRL